MTQTTFASILDAPAEEFVRPPALPAGQWIVANKGLPRRDKSTKKGTEFIEFTVQFIQPFEDAEGNTTVDADALAEFGDYTGQERKLTFYVTEKAGYRLREFLEDDLRLDLSGKSLWEAAQETQGIYYIVTIRHKARDDGKGVFDEIGSTAPMPE